MKTNFVNKSLIALAVCFSFGAQASTDFFGYARAGMHVSPDGEKGNGHPDYIRAEGAPNKYRLGNEDDWAELGVRHDLYENGPERAEIGFMMGTWHNPETRSNSFTIMQAWGQMYGILGSDKTSIWAGQRYTRNIADDMLDFKYWDNSGRGFGLRDIEAGSVLMDFATVYNNVAYDDVNNPDSTRRSAVLMPEFRVHGIDFLGGNLTLGANYAYIIDDTDIKKHVGAGNYDRDGYMFTVNHKASFAGTYNIFTVQMNGGIGVGGWHDGEGELLNLTTPGTSYRIMNHGFCTINEDWSCQYSLAYENISMDNASDDGKDWFAAGIRPKYNWNKYLQTEVELGYQLVNSDRFDDSNTSWKATLSQKVHFGTVPHIRFYATYAESETNWEEQSFGKHVATQSKEMDSWTFGVQFEAWW
ncbi:carbohydrate porin [Vibrio breoganii]